SGEFSFLPSQRNSNISDDTSDEEISLSIVRNLLNIYPKACRETSEGGRLPLHMACAGRASPGVVREILKHYGTDAARHRTKEGYLPFHLVALHG
ncbi:MAG: ankyrin repeat domain-containing protein, partial [bacterium]